MTVQYLFTTFLKTAVRSMDCSLRLTKLKFHLNKNVLLKENAAKSINVSDVEESNKNLLLKFSLSGEIKC